MIHPKELNQAAGENRVSDAQMEKDYILTWMLYGLSKSELLSRILVFKGGTVLKKAYLDNYRFSEDLDFTLLDEGVTNDELLQAFTGMYAFVREEANIELALKGSDIHVASGSLVFYINYVGPLRGAMGSRDVKIDITRGEVLEFAIEEKKIFVAYSDLPVGAFHLKCYSLSEILIEKMAALMGRLEPRDLYDFWYLTEIERLSTAEHKTEFERKARNKNHDPSMFAKKVQGKEKNLKQGWQRKLKNQIHDLPNFDDVFREAKRNFKF